MTEHDPLLRFGTAAVRGGTVALAGASIAVNGDPFEAPLVAALAVYAAFVTITVLCARCPPGVALVGDVLLIGAVLVLSGGAGSEARRALYLPGLVAATLMGPAITAMFGAAALATFGIVHAGWGGMSSTDAITFVLSLVWFALAAAFLAALLERRRAQALADFEARGRLAAELAEAQQRTRRELTEAVHAGPVQELSIALQDLEEVREGRSEALASAASAVRDALTELRELVSGLHPLTNRYAGVAVAAQILAARLRTRHGIAVEVGTIDEVPDEYRDLVIAALDELLGNVAKHAGAQLVEVTVYTARRATVLEVRDDGCGVAADRLESAVRDGHIGLAATMHRVEQVGGRFQIDTSRGHGTRVMIQLPHGALAP